MKEVRTSTTTTRVDLRKKLAEGGLSPMEERVLRMRAGIGEKADAKLEMKAIPNDEVRAKLAMIEQMTMDALRGAPQAQENPVVESNNPRKDHIIERLRRAKRDSR